MPDEHGLSGEQLSRLYGERFTPEELAFKQSMWKVFCESYFQQFIAPTETVVDLGAGSCEFINAIRCGEKIAVDLNPDLEHYLDEGKAVVANSNSMPEIVTGSVDVVFTSNFFEHLPNKAELLATLDECHRIVRDGGRLLVVMPNIRYLPGRYWDYFDHHLALTHYSLVEALAISGFRAEMVVPRFLPYTIKHTRLPHSLALVRLYMRVPLAWRVLGEQMFVVARRVDAEPE
ncbi:MAG: class I SAM-dependent methyltransferase [Acidimicrobiia bacterium]